jgi:[ribosomal protein S5]-alanine N-acetyltransferase
VTSCLGGKIEQTGIINILAIQATFMDFKLRPWLESDLESLVGFADNASIARNMSDFFPHPYTADKGRAFIAMAQQQNPPLIMAIEVENKAAGGIGLHPQHDIYRMNAELGYWLAEPYWGKGIITQAIQQMVRYGFENFEFTRIYARPFGHNKASQKALEKAGFVLEAHLEKTFFKNGEYVDELIFAIRKESLAAL